MKHCFILMGTFAILFISCKLKSSKKETDSPGLTAKNETPQQGKSAALILDSENSTLGSDSLLHLQKEDTIDCGAIINTLFHRSSYEFPVENGFKKEELTAVIEDAKDSILSIKIMLVDTVANDRATVDWLTLNCKNKHLETIKKNSETVNVRLIKYDVRLLDILMRECALDY